DLGHLGAVARTGVADVERNRDRVADLRRSGRHAELAEGEGRVGESIAEGEQRLRLVRIGGVPAVAEEHALAVFHGGVGARGMWWCIVEIVGRIVLPLAVET